MEQRQYLRVSLAGTLVALVLFVVVFVLAFSAGSLVGQEEFETVREPAAYAAQMTEAGPVLRAILAVDGLFMIAYTIAVGFAVLAFAGNNRVAAYIGGIGIVAVMLLDALENGIMAGSIDIVTLTGTVTLERIALQAGASAMKWQTAAAALVAVSFVLPKESLVEKLLVWGVRLGLPVAVPLFMTDAFGLRGFSGLLLAVSMGSGFLLLALVVGKRAKAA